MDNEEELSEKYIVYRGLISHSHVAGMLLSSIHLRVRARNLAPMMDRSVVLLPAPLEQIGCGGIAVFSLLLIGAAPHLRTWEHTPAQSYR